jgi:zinc protease
MRPVASRLCVIGAFTLLSSSVGGGPQPAHPAGAVPAIQYEKYSLDNGLEVILSEDHRLPLTAVNLWYHVGPANEEPGRTGFAHLFEHMMFQGSKHVATDTHFKVLEAAGASQINGTTDFDRTNYFETIASNQLELALWIESDRMGYLLDKVDRTAFANQQDVVRNERRQSVENQPYGIAEEALFHQLFPKSHPYYADVIGSHADVQAAQLDDVKAFFKQFYSPNNCSLAIAGDIDKAATKKLVEKYFGPLKRGADVPPFTAKTPAIDAERKVVMKDHVELPRLYVGWITSPIFKPGDADADIAAEILGGGNSSRLYKRLVYEQQIAQSVTAQQYSLILGSVFELTLTARPGHTVDELERALDAELEAFRRDGPQDAEVERARNSIETRVVRQLENLGGFGGVADRLNMYNHYLHDPGYLPKDAERHRAVTAVSVRTFAQQQLRTEARAIVDAIAGEQDLGAPVPTPPAVVAKPGEGAESLNPDAAWRNQQPKAGPQRALSLPVPQTFRLANGLQVFLLPRPGLPIVSASLVIRSGTEVNPPDRPGLAGFTGAMLTEGTASRSALQVADDAAQLGAALSADSSIDLSRVTTSSLTQNFPSALALVADVALHPAFPPEELERQRKSRLAALAENRANPSSVVRTVEYAALYGPQHPYAHLELGTDASIAATTRDDVVGFWKRNYVANNAALIVAGDVSRATLRPIVERTFGGWSPGRPAVAPVAIAQPTSARVIIVDTGAAQQSQVRVATIGAPRSTRDYPRMQVLNQITGGLFSSRINMNLREEHGYTYGAFSDFVFRRMPGPFFVSSGIRTDVTAPAIGEILKELKKLHDSPVTEDELALGRDAIVRGLPALFETSDRAVASVSDIYLYDLGPAYYSEFQRSLATVNTESVFGAARKYFVPERMIVVVVGDRAKIEPEIRKLNVGPIEFRDADGSLVKKAGSDPARSGRLRN